MSRVGVVVGRHLVLRRPSRSWRVAVARLAARSAPSVARPSRSPRRSVHAGALPPSAPRRSRELGGVVAHPQIMPSPSSTISSGEPTVSRQTTAVRSRSAGARMAPREAAHALHERLLRAGRDEQHAHARRPARSRSSRASSSSTATRGQVVVGARHDACAWRCRRTRQRVPSGDTCPSRRSRPARVSAPSATSAGPAATSRIICGEVVLARRTRPGRRRRRSGSARGAEDQPAVGGVVVGDEHDRRAARPRSPASATTL